jgi:hypothetical protein
VFENRVLKRIFGPKSEKLTGGWRTCHNEHHLTLSFSPNIIRVITSITIGLVWHVAHMGENYYENAYTVLVVKSEGKRRLGHLGIKQPILYRNVIFSV